MTSCFQCQERCGD